MPITIQSTPSTAAEYPKGVSKKAQNFFNKKLKDKPAGEPTVNVKVAETAPAVLAQAPTETGKKLNKKQLTVVVPESSNIAHSRLPEKAPSPLPTPAHANASPKNCICTVLTPKSIASPEDEEDSENDGVTKVFKFVAGLVGVSPSEPTLTYNPEFEDEDAMSGLTPKASSVEIISELCKEVENLPSALQSAPVIEEIAQRSLPSTPSSVASDEALASSPPSSPIHAGGEKSPSTTTALIVYDTAIKTLSLTPKASTKVETPRSLSIDLGKDAELADLSKTSSKSLDTKDGNMASVSSVSPVDVASVASAGPAQSPKASQQVQAQAQHVQAVAQEVVKQPRDTVLTHPILVRLRQQQEAAFEKASTASLEKDLDAQDLFTAIVEQTTALDEFLGTVGAFKEKLLLKEGAVSGVGYTCTEEDKAAFNAAGKTYESTSKKLVDMRESLEKYIASLDKWINQNASKIDARSLNLAEYNTKMSVDHKDYLPVEASWGSMRDVWINQKAALVKGVASLNTLNTEITTTLKSYQTIVDPKNETMLAWLAKPVTGPVGYLKTMWTGTPNTTYSITEASKI